MSDNLPRNMRMVVRNRERQLEEAEGPPPSVAPAPEPAPARTMSQADFSYGRKRTPAEEKVRQQKLVEKLRSTGY